MPQTRRLPAIPRSLRRLAAFGTETYPPRTARRLAVINLLSAMVSAITVPYVVLYLAWDWRNLAIPALTLLPQIVLFAVTPLWNRINAQAAGIHLCVVWLVFAALYTWYFGRDSGLHYFYLPGVAASMLIFGVEKMWRPLLVTLVAFTGFMVTERIFVQPAPFITVDPLLLDILFYLTVPFSFLLVFATVLFAFSESARANDALEREHARSELLVANMLPPTIAQRLKEEPGALIADECQSVSILFADVVDFTPRSALLPAERTVDFLNRIFSSFDRLVEHYGLEKIKTVGDAYMVAGGVPEPHDDHLSAIAHLAFAMREAAEEIGREMDQRIELRIGIHTGPVVAGVIGTHKYVYDVWGDTVNIASRMEEFSAPGRIQVTGDVMVALSDRFLFDERGQIEVKGLGTMRTWFLIGHNFG